MLIMMARIYFIAFVLFYCTVFAERLGEIYVGSDLAPSHPFDSLYCSNNGPVLFRPRKGVSVPNCLLPPGPVVGSVFIDIDLNSRKGYQCPNKGYLCGYHIGRRRGIATVKCCKDEHIVGEAVQFVISKLVSYRESECITSFRVDVPNSMFPALPGYLLVGAVPIVMPGGHHGFYNKECPFRVIRSSRRRGKLM